MRQFSGKRLVSFIPSSPIDVSPIRKAAPHFHQIYSELEMNASEVVLMQAAQETLLVLYCHKPAVFHDTPRDLRDIDVSILQVCLQAIEEDAYGYLQPVMLGDRHVNNVRVKAHEFMYRAFNSIYSIHECSPAGLRQRLFSAQRPNPNGTHFMVAVSRMLLAIGLRGQHVPAAAPP
jgi:hypothetical protein